MGALQSIAPAWETDEITQHVQPFSMIVVSDAGCQEANGAYALISEEVGGRPVWANLSKPTYRIQWFVDMRMWTLQLVDQEPLYSILDSDDYLFPINPRWRLWRNSAKPLPNISYQPLTNVIVHGAGTSRVNGVYYPCPLTAGGRLVWSQVGDDCKIMWNDTLSTWSIDCNGESPYCMTDCKETFFPTGQTLWSSYMNGEAPMPKSQCSLRSNIVVRGAGTLGVDGLYVPCREAHGGRPVWTLLGSDKYRIRWSKSFDVWIIEYDQSTALYRIDNCNACAPPAIGTWRSFQGGEEPAPSTEYQAFCNIILSKARISHVNGVYVPIDEAVGGLPIWAKVGALEFKIHWSLDSSVWVLSDVDGIALYSCKDIQYLRTDNPNQSICHTAQWVRCHRNPDLADEEEDDGLGSCLGRSSNGGRHLKKKPAASKSEKAPAIDEVNMIALPRDDSMEKKNHFEKNAPHDDVIREEVGASIQSNVSKKNGDQTAHHEDDMPSSQSTLCSNIVVRGAGTPGVDGLYVARQDAHGGRPVWTLLGRDEYRIRWSKSFDVWIIEYDQNTVLYRIDECNESTPPAAAKWTCFQGGEEPAPSIEYKAVCNIVLSNAGITQVNGLYLPIDEVVGGLPVWAKLGAPDFRIQRSLDSAVWLLKVTDGSVLYSCDDIQYLQSDNPGHVSPPIARWARCHHSSSSKTSVVEATSHSAQDIRKKPSIPLLKIPSTSDKYIVVPSKGSSILGSDSSASKRTTPRVIDVLDLLTPCRAVVNPPLGSSAASSVGLPITKSSTILQAKVLSKTVVPRTSSIKQGISSPMAASTFPQTNSPALGSSPMPMPLVVQASQKVLPCAVVSQTQPQASGVITAQVDVPKKISDVVSESEIGEGSKAHRATNILNASVKLSLQDQSRTIPRTSSLALSPTKVQRGTVAGSHRMPTTMHTLLTSSPTSCLNKSAKILAPAVGPQRLMKSASASVLGSGTTNLHMTQPPSFIPSPHTPSASFVASPVAMGAVDHYRKLRQLSN